MIKLILAYFDIEVLATETLNFCRSEVRIVFLTTDPPNKRGIYQIQCRIKVPDDPDDPIRSSPWRALAQIQEDLSIVFHTSINVTISLEEKLCLSVCPKNISFSNSDFADILKNPIWTSIIDTFRGAVLTHGIHSC